MTQSIILYSSQSGNLAVVELLIGIGTDIDATDDSKSTPLIHAAKNGN